MITIQHHYGKSILASLIRFFSRGDYNHTSILIGGYVYEAHIHTGVTKTKLKDWNPPSKVVASHNFYTDSTPMVMKWLDKQVGKKYDITGVIAFIFPLLPQRTGYWFCSELAFVALAKALSVEFSTHEQKKSPQDMFTLCKFISII